MKFMNRLNSANTSPTATSPQASPHAAFSDEEDGNGDDDNGRHSAKRRRTSGIADGSTGGEGSKGIASMADMEVAMRASMEEEERRRQAAVKKRAAELGDEQWTWDQPLPPQIAARMAAAKSAAAKSRTVAYAGVVRVGFAEIDRSSGQDGAGGGEASPRESGKPGIMLYNMKKSQTTEDDEQDDKTSESRKRPRSGSQKSKDTMAKLKGLESLSSQGGRDMKCHRCGRAGHKAAKCPSLKRSGSFKKNH